MRWISTVLSNSSTWFALISDAVTSRRGSRGAIQRSEMGSYHLPRLINAILLFSIPPLFDRFSRAFGPGVLRSSEQEHLLCIGSDLSLP